MKKVTLYTIEKVWRRLREHGSSGKLSSEVEDVLRSQIKYEELSTAFERLGIKVKGTFSEDDIRLNWPKLQGSPSEEILKEMRGKRPPPKTSKSRLGVRIQSCG